MSLVLTTRYRAGVLIAADSFVFDNHGEAPQKMMNFEKILVSKRHGIAMTYVGSGWVFSEAYAWLKKHKKTEEDIVPQLSDKWCSLDKEWKAEREKSVGESGKSTLRPVSASVLVIARQTELDTIHIIDTLGKMHQTKSFVISGSGQDIVKHFLQSTKQTFRSTDTLKQSLKLTQECFHAASHDLYVTGFPALAVVTGDGINDFSKKCAQYWHELEKRYWESSSKAAFAV